MADAFTFFLTVTQYFVTWLFSSDTEITLSSYTAPIGSIFIAIFILSVLIGSIVSFYKGPSSGFENALSNLGVYDRSKNK